MPATTYHQGRARLGTSTGELVTAFREIAYAAGETARLTTAHAARDEYAGDVARTGSAVSDVGPPTPRSDTPQLWHHVERKDIRHGDNE